MISQIGKYRIESEIGRGGFGRVFRAYDPSMRRQVAIKVLGVEGEPDMLARFNEEAEITGKLTHKNIITVYDYGEHAGVPYLVMELLEGESLQSIIREKRGYSLLERVEMMAEVAEGLAYAHGMGVVHRDVKPANIMRLASGHIKIMDFGIARLLMSDRTRLTQHGFLVGTMLYMAPEQFANFPPDALVDIFAYGVICYELLTGHQPFAGDNTAQVMHRITSTEPPPLRRFLPDCPEGLESLVGRAMAKERDARYPSADEILLDLAPVRLELRKDRAAEIMRDVPARIDAGDLSAAHDLLRRVLELDPSHREARILRDRLMGTAERKRMQQRAATLLEEGAARLAKRRFSEAVQAFEAAVQLDPADTAMRRRLDEAKSVLDASLRAAELLSQARGFAEQRQLADALRSATEATRLDPSSPEAADLCRQLTRELGAGQISQRAEPPEAETVLVPVRGGPDPPREAPIELPPGAAEWHIERIRHSIENHRWKEADACLEHAARDCPQEPALRQLALEIRRGRRDDLDRLAQAIYRCLQEGNREAASQLLSDTRQEFSEQPLWQTLQRDVDTWKPRPDTISVTAASVGTPGAAAAAALALDPTPAPAPRPRPALASVFEPPDPEIAPSSRRGWWLAAAAVLAGIAAVGYYTVPRSTRDTPPPLKAPVTQAVSQKPAESVIVSRPEIAPKSSVPMKPRAPVQTATTATAKPARLMLSDIGASTEESAVWRGTLPPGATLTIRGDQASLGTVYGALPLGPSKLRVQARPGTDLSITLPAQDNDFTLSVTNPGTEAETGFTVYYRLGQE